MPNATMTTQAASYIGYNNDGQYAKQVLADGPIRFYKLDEKTGNSVAADSSGNGGASGAWGTSVLHATSVTPSDYAGKSGDFSLGASSFDPNAVVTVPFDSAAVPSGSFSIEVVCYLAVGGGSFGTTNRMTIFEWQPATGIRIYCINNNGHMFVDIAGVQVIANGLLSVTFNPVHTLVTYNASTHVLSYYCNGVLQGSGTVTTPPTFTDGTGMRVGQDSVMACSWGGELDNVAVYKYALTQAQATAHANAAGLNSPGNAGGSVPRSIGAQSRIAIKKTITAASYIKGPYPNDNVYASTVLADAPLRYYKLDELTGNSVAVDSSGNGGVSGTWGSSVVHGPSVTASDYAGKSAQYTSGLTSFDANSVVTVPFEAAGIPSGSFSIELVCSFASGASGFGNGRITLFELQAATGVRLNAMYNNGQMFITVAGVQVIGGSFFLAATNTPTHVVVTYNATTKLFCYYANGVLRNSLTLTTLPTFTSGTGVRIGQDSATNPSWPGSIDNVLIYNYDLTATQALNHANAAGVNSSADTGGTVTRSLFAGAYLGPVASQSVGAASKLLGAYPNDLIYSRTVLADSPIRYYKLIESGTTALDYSGNNGPSGTYGSSVTRGRSIVATDEATTSPYFPPAGNTSYDANSIITFPEDSAIQFNGTSFSIEYFYNWPGDNPNFGGQECSYFNLEDATGIRVAFPPSQSVQTKIYLNNVAVITEGRGTYFGVGNHCVITFDSTTNTMKYYQNGTLLNTATVTPGTFNSGVGLRLGQRGIGSVPALYGPMGHVAIYGTVLSATQVTNHANAAGVNGYPGGTANRVLAALGYTVTPASQSITAASNVVYLQLVAANAASMIVNNVAKSIGAASYIGYNNDGQYAKTVTSDGAFRYYKLDELTGNSIAVDSSGNNGPSGTWGTSVSHVRSITASDYSGGAALFPTQSALDANANVAFPLDSAALPSGNFSIEFVCYPTNPLTQGNIGNGLPTLFEWQPSTGIRFVQNNYNDGRATIYVAGVAAIVAATFMQIYNPAHIVVTYNATTKLLSYYFNGTLAASVTLTTAPTFVDGTGFRIGQGAAASPCWNGTIDNVAIYKSLLTSTQVQNHAKVAGIQAAGQNGGTVARAISAGSFLLATHIAAGAIISANVLATENAASRIVASSTTSANAASYISIMTTATVTAASDISKQLTTSATAASQLTALVTRSITASSRLSSLALGTMNAASIITSAPVLNQEGAASRIVATTSQAITARSEIQQLGLVSDHAASQISQLVVSTIAASSVISHKLSQTINASSNVLGLSAYTIGAGAEISEHLFATIGAIASVAARASATINAASRIAAPFDVTINAASSVAAPARLSMTASSYVVVTTDVQADAHAYVVINTTESLGAAAFIPIAVRMTLAAATKVVILMYSFEIIEALAAIVTTGEVSAGAGGYVAFTVTSESLGAGATISQPFTPTLYAHAYLVIVALAAMGAGARVGTRTKTISNRELTVTPYYG